MSRSKNVIYPPNNVLNPQLGKSDYEFIILWMLSNNDFCTWTDFTAEISGSTLHGHLKRLINKNYIDKPKRNKYVINSKGIERFRELTYNKKVGKRRLKFPPKAILKKRNYDHWILWMLYNNYSCKWSDFKKEPLSINQSSLSNNLNSLIEDGFVVRENKEYLITPLGKTEYFSVLKQYDLDRQSILEQESKRIEEITEKTFDLFNNYNIKDSELKYRYINYVLKLPYSKVESTLKDEEDFNKIILFLSINHPNQYPDYISPEDFSRKYNISPITLNYYIQEIVEKQFFEIKFFKIEDIKKKVFYFQKNEPLEKILNAIVEKNITKFTYLNKFQENPSLDIELLLDNISNDICDNIFNEKLKLPLRNFLPEYIKYLAYRIETEDILIDNETMLEGFVWQNVFEEFQTFEPPKIPSAGFQEPEEYFFNLDKSIFDVLNIVYLSKLYFLKTEEVQKTYFLKNTPLFDEFVKLLYRDKVTRYRDLFERNRQKFPHLSQLILEDTLFTVEHNYDDSIQISSRIIKEYPNEFIGYLLKSITYFLMDNYEKSLEVINKGIKKAPHLLLICHKFQIQIKLSYGSDIFDELNEISLENPQNITLLRVKLILNITHWQNLLFAPEESFNNIKSVMKLDPNNTELKLLKAIILLLSNKLRESKRVLINEINLNIFQKNPKIHSATFFLLTFSYTACGKFTKALKIANQLCELYPNHPLSFLSKALIIGYNLVYHLNKKGYDIDKFLRLIDASVSHEAFKYNKAKYLIFKTIILYGIKQYDNVMQTINSAIDLIPTLPILYNNKAQFLIAMNKNLEALDLIENSTEKYPNLKELLYKQKVCALFKEKQFEQALNVTNDLLESNSTDHHQINNKALILARLGKKEESLKTANYLIKLNPYDSNSYDTFGEIYIIFGEYEKAIEKFKESLKINPTSMLVFHTHLRLGFCFMKLENYDQALEYIRKSKELAQRMIPNIKDFYLNEAEKYLSEIREKMGSTKN